eukprot:m51a1_g6272 putative immediate early response 3-interacting protein 1 (83) ;mRNA; r:148164-148617
MAFTLGSLLLSVLLFVNALCVLNNERFLSRIGWGNPENVAMPDGRVSEKKRLLMLYHSLRVLVRIPLIVVNVVSILLVLILG